jgi:DNA uptake protein ComE-like DNA-binding protein
MKLNIEPIRNWFGFTRRERRSTFILLVIAFLILGLRYTVPDKNLEIKDLSDSILFIEEDRTTSIIKEERSKSLSSTKYNSSESAQERPVYQKRAVINLNNCDTSQLISLPGIGPVLSVRIIKYRNLLGGFASVEQLKEVYGLSAETYGLIRERVIADSTLITRIKINTAGYKELAKLPYFEKYEVTAILKYKELEGRIESINDLIDNKLIPAEKVPRVRPYLDFN